MNAFWFSVLVSQHLHFGHIVTGKKVPTLHYEVKVYNPQLGARQFGLTQVILAPTFHSFSLFQTQCHSLNDSAFIEGVISIFVLLLQEFAFPGYTLDSKSTKAFRGWWKDFINPHRERSSTSYSSYRRPRQRRWERRKSIQKHQLML